MVTSYCCCIFIGLIHYFIQTELHTCCLPLWIPHRPWSWPSRTSVRWARMNSPVSSCGSTASLFHERNETSRGISQTQVTQFWSETVQNSVTLHSSELSSDLRQFRTWLSYTVQNSVLIWDSSKLGYVTEFKTQFGSEIVQNSVTLQSSELSSDLRQFRTR